MAESRKKLAADVWGSVLQLYAALTPEFDRRLRAAADLPLTWYDVLLELSSADGHRLTMGQLGERVVLSRSRVSRLVDDLAGVGLVCRESHPEDARSSYAVLTDAGLQRFRDAAPIYVSAIEEHFSALSAGDLKAVQKALGSVLERTPRR
jgi:DNA-binding MarR family transcriptional regulator